MRMLKLLCLGMLLLCPTLGSGQDKARTFEIARLSGMWRGVYSYPEGGGQGPVNFQLTLIQDGDTVVGFIKEPNTFGERPEPWLHATFRGRFDEKTRELTFTKTYDGTAGPAHDVEYKGEASKDRSKVEGAWNIGEFSGRFTLEKMRLDDQTLESLKKGPSKD